MRNLCISIILLLFQTSGLFAQRTITGTVTTNHGEGIPGVIVTVKETTVGTTTDIDGNYSIEVSGNAILIFSLVGLLTQEVVVKDLIENIEINIDEFEEMVEPIVSGDCPEFEFPPPKPSSRFVFSRDLFIECEHLGDVDSILNDALLANDYSELSYYAVPNGFALVTRIEKINDDGTSKESFERWNISTNNHIFTIKDYMKALFIGSKGYYRVIVFIVTNKSFNTSSREISRKEALAWLDDGCFFLPEYIANIKFSRRYNVISLIYEFVKTESEEPYLSNPSKLTGHNHLEKSNILPCIQTNQ